MLDKRTFNRLVLATAASAVVLSQPFAALAEGGFTPLTDDGEIMTCRFPSAETVVDVKLRDGSITKAMFDCNIMEAGDWDFATLTPDGEYGDDTLADQVVAWRLPVDA